MSNMGDSVENISVDDFLEFVSEEGETFLSYTTFQLGQFVENGFLKTLFDKNPQRPVDKAQLLVDMFGEFGDMGDSESEYPSANDKFGSTYISTPKTTPKPVHVTPPILPDVEMTPVDLTVTPKTSWKKDKQKARIAENKQVIHQSFTANPEAQTPNKKNTLFLGAKTSAPGLHIY
ncbi:hypothetical protein RhiirA5_435466 [Rhizophagus irregularis]|uniref:Uncharacterized protein n=1 Tax=Rhizophagus irregularis TaxID=588596 RepID=A0A2N0NND7_9GLOM|nr:hypothetical protein RhiirA5_435466 [Rhizophagus irregularis]